MTEQVEDRDAESVGDSLDRLQREVPFSALHAAQVGAVDAEDVREGLLAQAPPCSECSDSVPDRPLQLTFHREELGKGATCQSTDR